MLRHINRKVGHVGNGCAPLSLGNLATTFLDEWIGVSSEVVVNAHKDIGARGQFRRKEDAWPRPGRILPRRERGTSQSRILHISLCPFRVPHKFRTPTSKISGYVGPVLNHDRTASLAKDQAIALIASALLQQPYRSAAY